MENFLAMTMDRHKRIDGKDPIIHSEISQTVESLKQRKGFYGK